MLRAAAFVLWLYLAVGAFFLTLASFNALFYGASIEAIRKNNCDLFSSTTSYKAAVTVLSALTLSTLVIAWRMSRFRFASLFIGSMAVLGFALAQQLACR
jgi:hypothetical protein